MRFERFKTFADMLAYAVKAAATFAPGSVDVETGVYEEGTSFRPCVVLYPENGEPVSLRWYAFETEEGVNFFGRRARVEAREAGDVFAEKVRHAIGAQDAIDLRRAPFEELGDTFPAEVCRVTARNENGNRTNYQVWVFATGDAPPAVGDIVTGVFNRIGDCRVTGYFREGGYVGITADLLSAEVIKRNAGKAKVYLFPTEYRTAAPAPKGWTEIEGGAEGTSLEDIDRNAAAAMASPGTPIELFEGCTMLALGSPADADALPGLLAAALGEAPAAPAFPGFSLRLGDGYPFPFPKGLSEDSEDEINQDAPNHSLKLQGVKSFEWRFTMTVQFTTWEAFKAAEELTGWRVWSAGELILEASTSHEDGREFPAIVVKDKAYCQIFIES